MPRLIVDTVATALVQSALGPGYSVSGILALLENPGRVLTGADALGDGTSFDPGKLNDLFSSLGALPGGLTLAAAGTDPTTISLTTGTKLGGVLSLAAGLTIDRARHCSPSGTITLQADADGSGQAAPSLILGLDAAGLSLVVTTGGASPMTIRLLPIFDGAAALAGQAKKLLPFVLDTLLLEIAPEHASPPAIVSLALQVAAALDLYDPAGRFQTHATQLAAMVDGSWLASVGSATRTQFIAAAERYFTDATSPLRGALPGTFASTGGTLVWTYPLPAEIGAGTLSLTAGWDALGPTLTVHAKDVTLANAPLQATIDGGLVGGALTAQLALGIDLSSALGIAVAPQLVLAAAGEGVALTLLPLGVGTVDTLSIPLLPAAVPTASSDAALRLLINWAVPFAADVLLSAVSDQLAAPLWTGGRTVASMLTDSGLVTATAGLPPTYAVVTPLDLAGLPGRLLRAMSGASLSLATNPPLDLSFVDGGSGKLGVRLLGSIPLNPGDATTVSLLFGKPADWLGPSAGVTLDLFAVSGSDVTFAPGLSVRGLGIGLASSGDAPVANAGGFRIGSIEAYLAFEVELGAGGLSVAHLGAGVEIDELGIPLGALDSGTSTNPVAASLLSNGSTPTSGDSAGANPSLDVVAYYLDGALTVQIEGDTKPVVIPVHASLGPLYVDQLELALNGLDGLTIGVDGSLKINGFEVAVDELSLNISFPHLLQPEQWTLDLQGLAVAFESDAVDISGGLRKNLGAPIDYEGMLSVRLPAASLGIVAAYARPSDALGGYTSLFMFAALGEALGGPPFAFITGLGGGFGYNRELVDPDRLLEDRQLPAGDGDGRLRRPTSDPARGVRADGDGDPAQARQLLDRGRRALHVVRPREHDGHRRDRRRPWLRDRRARRQPNGAPHREHGAGERRARGQGPLRRERPDARRCKRS